MGNLPAPRHTMRKLNATCSADLHARWWAHRSPWVAPGRHWTPARPPLLAARLVAAARAPAKRAIARPLLRPLARASRDERGAYARRRSRPAPRCRPTARYL